MIVFPTVSLCKALTWWMNLTILRTTLFGQLHHISAMVCCSVTDSCYFYIIIFCFCSTRSVNRASTFHSPALTPPRVLPFSVYLSISALHVYLLHSFSINPMFYTLEPSLLFCMLLLFVFFFSLGLFGVLRLWLNWSNYHLLVLVFSFSLSFYLHNTYNMF